MADQPARSSSLRAVVPTLEPDEAFLARLSSLAAAGAPVRESAAAPHATWRVGLVAASVAAVLVGAAWLTGLGSPDGPDPTPAPTTPASTPGSPDPTPTAAAPTERTRPTATSGPSSTTSGPPSTPAGGGPGGTAPPTGQPNAPAGSGGGPDQNPGQHQGNGQGNKQGNGPDEHAGDHPNQHATDKAGNAHEHGGSRPGHGAGGRQPR
ncbi:MAG: hypothetical protein JWN91_2119 [Nocardioides sp.]|jgi:hypothetical protein|nr:hypothetical protein [Nocardioides sp.]